MHRRNLPKAKKDAHMDGKGKSESQPTRDRDIKCFKCYTEGAHCILVSQPTRDRDIKCFKCYTEGAHCILVSKPKSDAYKRQSGG